MNTSYSDVSSCFTELTNILIKRNISISTMESCTSGLIASLLTDTEGASAIFKGSFVTYSNEAKINQGVDPLIIKKYGVYSTETAQEMALACKTKMVSDIGIGVTGTFGNPDPANPEGTCGQVFFSICYQDTIKNSLLNLNSLPDRLSYKLSVALVVAEELINILNNN